ncbi:hypothetical protein FQ085_00760 [Planococcus sp. ANT_H30]|uniref:hypothetical protein n=1 Tax=Planococcus sp. ANT_H30 TaxID=2597347 RepID=UPI0011ED625C|nr:hypothetical protein [Planococcus sp. ANT_H30]KAA0958276.1 hypothetical protein FQ085_00760 [Planococcus sp. ANT_H30]
MIFRKINTKTGLFIEDVLRNTIPTNEDGKTDPQYVDMPVPQGFYWPKWTGTEWVEGGKSPESQPTEPTETEVLQAQLKASNDYMDFLEEVIVEMAQKICE